MRFLRQRWDRLGGPTVRPLTIEDEAPLREMIDADPVTHLFAAEHLERVGLPRSSLLTSKRSASPFAGIFAPLDDDGRSALVGAAWLGANLVPIRVDPADLGTLATYIESSRRDFSSLFGPAGAVMGLWERLRAPLPKPLDVRPDQPLMVLRGDAPRSPEGSDACVEAGISPVRWSGPGDVERIMPAAVAMFTEEVGYSPLERDAEGYTRRVAEGVRSGRTVLATDSRGNTVFKTDIGLSARGICQLQGVWLAPSWRGRGLSEALMTQACGLIGREYGTISLYVNSYNAPARALYRAVGFDQVGTFATVLF